MVASQPSLGKVVPKAYTFVQSQGALSPTHCKSTVERKIVSPLASLLMDGRLAKFLL